MGQKYEEAFEDWEVRIVKGMVGRFMAKWACLAEEDFDSLVGECLVQWLIAKPQYDPGRGASEQTFMATVVHNRLMDLVRERSSLKHEMVSKARSLEETCGSDAEDDLNLIETIDSGTSPDAPRDPLEISLLKEDLRRVVPGLSGQQQRLYELLLSGKTKKAAAKILNISRDTVNEERKRIKKVFEKADLGGYLK